MWSVTTPAFSTRDSFLAAATATREVAQRDRYLAAESSIIAKATAFKAAAAASQTHSLNPASFKVAGVPDDEMVDLYNKRLVGTRAGRVIYDAIMAGPEHGRCPLCGQQPVSTLDHHLPKNVFSALTVEPTNLVPVCKDCNFAKSNSVASAANEEPIHPYFDALDADPWLTATVVQSSPAALLFQVVAPPHWAGTLASRVQRQFDRLGLAALYSSLAATELSNIRGILKVLQQAGGPSLGSILIQERLSDDAQSREASRVNSWHTALYKALAADSWYWSGGFLA
jgi:hypothetical protein